MSHPNESGVQVGVKSPWFQCHVVIPVHVAAPGLVVMGCGPGGLGRVLALEMIKESATPEGRHRSEQNRLASSSSARSSPPWPDEYISPHVSSLK